MALYFMVVDDEDSLIFHSDKQWEEYDVLTKIDGYELDYQDVSSGAITVRKVECSGTITTATIDYYGSTSIFY